MQYIIITARTLEGLEHKLNAWAKNRWVAQGGAFKVMPGKYAATMGRRK